MNTSDHLSDASQPLEYQSRIAASKAPRAVLAFSLALAALPLGLLAATITFGALSEAFLPMAFMFSLVPMELISLLLMPAIALVLAVKAHRQADLRTKRGWIIATYICVALDWMVVACVFAAANR